jgi:multidrug efflux system outer membrane protein
LIGIARTAYLPSLTLTADGGFASRDLGTFLDRNSSVWSLAVGLGLTIFDGGRRDALVRSATAGYDGTRALYEKSVLEAIREVQDSLNDIEASRARVTKYVEASRTSEATASLSRSRYRHGYISYFEVVDSDRNALNAQRTLIHSQQALAVSTVSLVKALGGGWQSSDLEVRSASGGPAR